MIDKESYWSLGLIGLLLLGFLLFRRMRLGTRDFNESREARRRLTPWARTAERVLLYVLLAATTVSVFLAFSKIHAGRFDGATAVFAWMGAVFIAFPLSALGANAVSWLTPPIRRANLESMAETQVSFATANRGLLLSGVVMIPIGMVLLTIAALQPWAR
jgi:hypothetical protein